MSKALKEEEGEGCRKENFKACLGGKVLDGELTELMRQKGSTQSQPGFVFVLQRALPDVCQCACCHVSLINPESFGPTR